uniref:Uncharacterized protein n=1 Tax=Caenorhabditis japonica TaxID=281687 RepID=A0A8R1E6T7_CAEJA
MPSVTTVDEIAPMQPMLTLKDKPTAAQQLANIKPPEEKARVYNTIPGIKRRLTAKFKVAERLIKTANQIINYSADTEAYYAVVKRVCNILQTYIHSFKNITDEVEGILSISPMLNPTTEIREKNLARMIEWIEASNIQQMLSELEKLNNQGLEMLEVFATNLEQGHSPSPKEDTGSPAETELEKFEALADDPEQLTNELMDWDNIDEISTTNLDDITSPVNVNKEILETRNNSSRSSFSQAQSLTAAAQRNTTIGSLHIQPLLHGVLETTFLKLFLEMKFRRSSLSMLCVSGFTGT